MKFLKNFFIGLLVLILINLMGVLMLSCNLKKILVDGVIKESITTSLMPNITNDGIQNISDNEKIQKILNDPNTQKLIDKYLDIVVNGLIDEENINELELEEDITNYLKENKEELSELTGEEITDEMIDETTKELKEQDLNKVVKETLENTNNTIGETEKTVLKGYKKFVSLEFRLTLIFLVLIDLLLIAILQKSFYKWIKLLGTSMITSGILVTIMAIAVKVIVTTLSPLKSFNTSSLLITSIVTTIVGIVIIIAYNIITKNIEKKEVEISEVS